MWRRHCLTIGNADNLRPRTASSGTNPAEFGLATSGRMTVLLADWWDNDRRVWAIINRLTEIISNNCNSQTTGDRYWLKRR